MSITFDEYLEKNSYATFTHYELKKHDAQVRADAIEEYKKAVLDAIIDAKNKGEEHCKLKVFLDDVAEQLKEKQNENNS